MKNQMKAMILVAGLVSAAQSFAGVIQVPGQIPGQIPGQNPGQQRPALEGLQQAKQICMGMSKKVKSLIALAQTQPAVSGSQFSADEEGMDDVLENDTAALFALRSMGNGTFTLGQSLDQAMQNYYSPDFEAYHAQVCAATAALVQANWGAKTAASLPSVGQINPGEFDHFDLELEQVKASALCY